MLLVLLHGYTDAVFIIIQTKYISGWYSERRLPEMLVSMIIRQSDLWSLYRQSAYQLVQRTAATCGTGLRDDYTDGFNIWQIFTFVLVVVSGSWYCCLCKEFFETNLLQVTTLNPVQVE